MRKAGAHDGMINKIFRMRKHVSWKVRIHVGAAINDVKVKDNKVCLKKTICFKMLKQLKKRLLPSTFESRPITNQSGFHGGLVGFYQRASVCPVQTLSVITDYK